MQFIPERPKLDPAKLVYFEDSHSHGAAGYSTKKTHEQLKGEIAQWLRKLGADTIAVTSGQFQDGATKRYGFQFEFQFGGARGRITCAALPMRRETQIKRSQAERQALYLLAASLAAQYAAQYYQPGNYALLPYLIGEGGRTLGEAVLASGGLPLLAAGANMR